MNIPIKGNIQKVVRQLEKGVGMYPGKRTTKSKNGGEE